MQRFFPRRLARPQLAVIFFVFSASAFAQGLSFDAALRMAAQRAPLLQARNASIQGAQALQTSASQLPDPKLSVGIDSLPINGPDRGSLVRDNFTQRQLGWTQEVPNQAKRAARSDAAAARTQREQALLQVDQFTVRRETGMHWLAHYYAAQRLALFDTLIAQQRLLQDTATGQLAAGKIAPAEVSQIKLEVLALADRRDELQRDVRATEAALRRLTGAAPDTPLSSEVPSFKVDLAALQSNLDRLPEITALEPLRAMAQAELREAEAARSGDWSWGLRYGKRGPAYSDFASVQLTFDLPLFQAERQQPQITARQKELLRLELERDDIRQQQLQGLDTLRAELAEIDNKLERLIRQAIPLAEERSALTLAAYQSGRDKLAPVLEARKQQTEIGLRLIELQGRQRALQWRLSSMLPEPAPS